MARASTVFISYAHGSIEFQDRVLALADRLESLGLTVEFDQYEQNPEQGWTKWMLKGIQRSDFVVCICTEDYYERVNEDQDQNVGLGVLWEGSSLYNLFQSEPEQRKKAQVVQFDKIQVGSIPLPLRSNNRFALQDTDLNDQQFELLYRVLTFQPRVGRPERGSLVELPHRNDVASLPTVFPPVPRKSTPRSGSAMGAGRVLLPPSDNSSRSAAPKAARASVSKGSGSPVRRLAKSIVDKGYKFLDDDYMDLALANSKKAQQVDGSYVAAKILEADVEFYFEHYKEALAIYNEYAPLLRESATIRLLICRYGLGDPEVTFDFIYSKVRASRDKSETFPHLSSLLRRERMHHITEKYASELLSDFGANPTISMSLAVSLWEQRRFSEAHSLLEEVVVQNPRSSTAWANLGVSRADVGRFGLAIQALRKASSLAPRYQFPVYALAEVYALMKETGACIEALRELQDKNYFRLQRVMHERTFDVVRGEPEFQAFLQTVLSDGQ